jgi:hypothetical protein
MPYCPKCGKEVLEDTTYCPHCGSHIRAPAPAPAPMPSMPPTPPIKKQTKLQVIGKITVGIVIVILIISVISHWYVPSPPLPVSLVSPSPSDVTQSSIILTWTKSKDPDFAKYEIYRSTSPGVIGTLIATITNQAVTSYMVTGLSAGTTYYFTIRVVDTEGLTADSHQISVTTLMHFGKAESTLDVILDQIEDKLFGAIATNYSVIFQVTYEAEELLGKAIKEYSAIAEKLSPDESHGYKIRLMSINTWIKGERYWAESFLLGDTLGEAIADPNILPQVEIALTAVKNAISEYRQAVDDLQKIYEQDPKTAEEWGLTPNRIAEYRNFITDMEDLLDEDIKLYEDIKASWKEYLSIKEKNIKVSSEIRDRLMALGIIPSDLASFFDRFDEDGNGRISLDEGQKFYYWVEKNIKYRYDDENSKEGIARLGAGFITRGQLGDGRPGSEYWQKPYETFKERYGDCEDMAILETAFYSYFGVEAYVVTVSVKRPGIVDHALCIARIGDNLDEYRKYLGRLNYYIVNGKYFMMVDNAYSNKYGYISGGTIGVDVDFSPVEYRGRYLWSLEQISAEWWGS